MSLKERNKMNGADLFSGKYVMGKSIVHRLDSAVKLLCFLILIAAVVISDSIYAYAFILVCIAAIIALSRIVLVSVLSPIRRMWLFFIIIFLMNAMFFISDNSIFSWWIFSLSVGGILQGLNVVIHVALVIVLGSILTMTTKPMDITNALSRLMKPLGLFGIPVEEIAMIISVAIQFIPTLIEETDMIKKAQIARGARFESKRIIERAVSFFPLLIPVFISAFRRADELSMAMEARGYRSNERHRVRLKAKINYLDIISLFVCASVLALQILFR